MNRVIIMNSKESNLTRSPLWWLLPATMAALSLIFLYAALLYEPPGAVAAQNALSLEDTAQAQTHMMVVDEGGRVCVYLNDELMLSTDIPIASLPLADREALSNGIIVDSQAELTQLLEDLGS